MEDSNRSNNPDIHEVSVGRRQVLHSGLAAVVGGVLAPLSGCTTAPPPAPLLGFKGVPPSTADRVVVPEGYRAQVLLPWGEPVGMAGAMPAFKPDASNTADEQAVQMGMHHDGMHYYPLPSASPGAADPSSSGLLVTNHEYVDDRLLHPDGRTPWTAEKVRKAQAAHGVSVVEIARKDGQWLPVRPSRHARRITAATPIIVSGPAAGHVLLRTAADPGGRRVLGTLNNCGSGKTPWGTYLTCEENFINYFKGPEQLDPHHARWGLKPGDPAGYRWHAFDERFDATLHPNEPNRFGWVVEIDPLAPGSPPIKRTALGRAAHEGATVATTREGRAVVYMGEDARFEYIYKFVSRDTIRPGGAGDNRTLLDHGTLYVARFNADGSGDWLPLVHAQIQGQTPLTPANGFADQGEVLIKTRQASDLLGATKMDRPEWVAIDPERWVYCSLTNNGQRGTPGRPGVDAANPRANNVMGHIIRWREEGDFDQTRFTWNHFVLAGDPAQLRPEARGTINGDAFAGPDGLWVDGRGVLWIQTDRPSTPETAALGHNALLAADPRTGLVKRFLTGPAGCEITGATGTPDGRTLFINIQHPGEGGLGDAGGWPDHQPGGRPRSATVAITRADGGVVGT